MDPEIQSGKPAAGPDPALAALRERTAGQPVDLVGDVFWVYQRMSDPGTVPDDAPGLGAWTLLEWARKYQRAFFDKLLPKAQAVREKAGEASDDELYRREMKTIRELKEMLRPYMEDLEVKCPNCGFSLDAETWKKHLEARKVTEQRPKQRWGEDG